jgi:Ca-activated chloride channel family protein
VSGAWLAGLFGPGGFALERPWLLPAVAVPALLWTAFALRGTAASRAFAWPALAEARAAGALRMDPLAPALWLLRGGALLALAAVLAGPLRRGEHTAETRPGLDLVLAVDASGSMRALDAEVGGEWRRRLDLAREVVARFAAQRASEGDRVGVVVFGDTAFTLCPLTGDGALLASAVGRVEAGMAGESTALGDALALAVKRATGGGEEDAAGAAGAAAPREGRLVVLLTDGRSNAGAVPVDVAAALAAATGTRVHTVGIGTGGEVAMASRSGGGRELRFERHDLDRETLRTLAAASGGRSFEARSSADLAAVYAEIDAVERVEREAPPRPAGDAAPEPFLAGAGALLLAELLLGRVAFRRIP